MIVKRHVSRFSNLRKQSMKLGERLQKHPMRTVESFVIGVLIRQLRFERPSRLERLVPIVHETVLESECFRDQITYRFDTHWSLEII